MSLSALEWAWSLLVSPTQKLVLLALADHANEDRECWPSLSRLSARTGLSPSGVKDALNALERAHLVIRERDRGRVTIYRLGINGHPTRPGGGLGQEAAKPRDGSTRPGGGLGQEAARPSGGSTRPSGGLGQEAARPSGGSTRPPGGPELGRLAATNRKLNRKEPLAASSSSRENRVEQSEKPARLALRDLPQSWQSWATEARPDLDLDAVWIGFRDYWQAATGDRAVSADWFAVWRKWVKREYEAKDDKTGATGVNGRDHRPDYTKGATPLEDIPWMQ
ncbi:helix-turn-helix domain-containing protein [Thiocystis violacea]|uniref:helix-turn-helix domain-containing protein n=1 Tax=Thiocystis violacea TaxID=13725 RepID=UPI001906D7BC